MTDTDPRTQWATRMQAQTPAAEAAIEPGDTFDPHDGQESDLNLLAADLLADPDESFDPTRRV